MSLKKSHSISPSLITWLVVASVGGVFSLILPPSLFNDGLSDPAPGWPLIPWFAIAWANVRVSESIICFFVIGLVLGIAQPRRWWLLALVAVATPAILLSINIVHDWTRDPTSHNLFPFEFLIYAFASLPAIVGAFLGFISRQTLQKKATAEQDETHNHH